MPDREVPPREREIFALYSDRTVPIAEILRTYSLTGSQFYRLLQIHHIPTRQRHPTRKNIPTVDMPALPPANGLAITTDAQGFVEHVERVKPSSKMYTWEVRFESAIRVEATDIGRAIAEVQAMPMCRRVFNVALKGAL